jgi:hypothetical protein
VEDQARQLARRAVQQPARQLATRISAIGKHHRTPLTSTLPPARSRGQGRWSLIGRRPFRNPRSPPPGRDSLQLRFAAVTQDMRAPRRADGRHLAGRRRRDRSGRRSRHHNVDDVLTETVLAEAKDRTATPQARRGTEVRARKRRRRTGRDATTGHTREGSSPPSGTRRDSRLRAPMGELAHQQRPGRSPPIDEDGADAA